MEGIAAVFFILVIAAIAIGSMVWHYSRAQDVLTGWAKDNGYEIVSSERCWFWRGPFFFRTSKGQEVYYVTVRAPDDQLRRGWVRCGGWFLGLFSDQADVEWDE